jgi:Na+/H+ antiporter
MPILLASLTVELTIVMIVAAILLIASLVALAPLKKIRLPFTVALMLIGFAVGASINHAERSSLEHLAHDMLAATPLAELQTPADELRPPADWRRHLDAGAREELTARLAGLDARANAAEVAERLFALPSERALLLKRAVASQAHGAEAADEPSHVGLLDQIIFMVSLGGHLSPSLIFFVFLPPLVFESAFAMDARALIRNLAPVLVLAVPVLILSTAITGTAVMLAGGASYGLTWEVALLFGALISATDPVAVVALFKDLGAPKRLGILVEGESLFNDGTAIVLFNILLAMAVASYGDATAPVALGGEVLAGVLAFSKVAVGGIVVGLILAWAVFSLIGSITSKEHVEISLSLVLAYAAFVVAEHFLHVSGVMATVAAGLTAGSYGKTKVSPSVEHFMHAFWGYMGFVMNSLIFFCVGLVISRQLSLDAFRHWLPVLLATLVAVIAARALGVFGSVPLVHRFVERIDGRYQAVMFWGGLRGAVSLALALAVFSHPSPSLPEAAREGVLVLASGVVLFTLLVNALSMEPLIKALGLDRPSPTDQFALAYAERERVDVGAKVVARLEHEGAVLPAVLETMRQRLDERHQSADAALNALGESIGDDPGAAHAVAARVALAFEKGDVLQRYQRGELTEAATKALLASADALLDGIRQGRELPKQRLVSVGYGPIESRLLSLLEPLPGLGFAASSGRRCSESSRATRCGPTRQASGWVVCWRNSPSTPSARTPCSLSCRRFAPSATAWSTWPTPA